VSLNPNNTLPHLFGFYDEICTGIVSHRESNTNTESAWIRVANIFRLSNRIEVTQTLSSTLRYSALSLLQTNTLRTIDNILESADLFKKIVQSMFHWIDCNKGQPREEEIYYHILKIILPSLSFIDSMVIELQLMQICMYTIRKLVLCLFDGYMPSKELLDLAKSNNFTLLRARAQEQIIKFKCHCMGSVSALAYNLTHIVTGLEIIQRFGCAVDSTKLLSAAKQNSIAAGTLQSAISASSLSIKNDNLTAENRLLSPRRRISAIGFASKLLSKETTGPKIIGIRSTSIDADLNNCALSAVRAITNELMNSNNGGVNNWKESETILNSLYNSDASLVMVEVALAAAVGTSNTNR